LYDVISILLMLFRPMSLWLGIPSGAVENSVVIVILIDDSDNDAAAAAPAAESRQMTFNWKHTSSGQTLSSFSTQ